MGSAEFVLDMILMKQMAGITNFQTIQMIQAMPEHSGLDGDSTDSSVTNLALEEPEAMQSEAIEKEVISIADIPALILPKVPRFLVNSTSPFSKK